MSTPETLAGRRIGFAVLVLALGIGGGLRFWLSFNDDGIFWPDEITQSLEPAHRLVFGYGFIPRDFVEGIRNWTFPALCAALLKLATLFGLSEPRGYLGLVRVVFSIVGLATAYATFRLARSYDTSTLAAACGAALFALAAPFIYFAPRAMSEAPSALLVALGFALALRRPARRWESLVGTSLLGLAVLIRLQNGVFCLGLLGILAARRQWHTVVRAGLVLIAWTIVYGLIDWLTWGVWFHSATAYVRYNIVEFQSNPWVGPLEFYARGAWTSMRWSGVVMALLSLLAIGRAPGIFLTAMTYAFLHSAIEHKEFRFILPAAPLFCALAGIGLDCTRHHGGRIAGSVCAVALLGTAVISAVGFRNLTFGDLGEFRRIKPSASAYDESGPVNRLLLAAYEQPDLCGLKIEVEEVQLVWTGGYTYLHRAVPFYPSFGPRRESGHFNYVIYATRFSRPGVVARESNLVLQRLDRGECLLDPNYDWRLP